MIIKSLNFVKTCDVCPEQYDVFDEYNMQVGYIRMRFGRLKCEYPDVGGQLIYFKQFDEEFKGTLNDGERIEHLSAIADAITRKILEDKFIKLEQVKIFDMHMRWTCKEISKVINGAYLEIGEYYSYDTNEIETMSFNVMTPESSIGSIIIDYNTGKIGRINVLKEYYNDDAIVNVLQWLTERKSIDPNDLDKIRFIKNNIDIAPSADQKILWFIANFLFYQDGYNAECIAKQFRAGYCLHFAHILKAMFRTGEICWAAPYGHIVYVHDEIPYDIEGINQTECEVYIPISYIEDGIKDFERIPGELFNASNDYIYDAIKRYKKDTCWEG